MPNILTMKTKTVTIRKLRRHKKKRILSLWNPLNDTFHRLHFGQSHIVGSNSGCDIMLKEEGISASHAVLSWEGSTVTIRDLNSHNGIRVNGRKVGMAKIQPGDVILFGNVPAVLVTSAGSLMKAGPFHTRNTSLRRELERLMRVAPSPLPILILGDSGTGKELAASLVHARSRDLESFVSINCGAIPESLLHSELFGHVKGSFSGAVNDHKGAFERAHRGSLFLDEIGELPADHQAAMLRALESGEVLPVGGERVIKVDTRIIAGTNRPLEKMVDEGDFRLDLYYRLSAITITLPTLHERLEDLPMLIRGFGADPARLDARQWLTLLQYPWPGNVRELRNVVSRASWLDWDTSLAMLPDSDITSSKGMLPADGERDRLVKLLRDSGGNMSMVARVLDVPRTTLRRRINQLGLDELVAPDSEEAPKNSIISTS